MTNDLVCNSRPHRFLCLSALARPAVVLVMAAVVVIYVFQALGAPPDPKDDPLWVNRAQIWPIHVFDAAERGRQIDVASGNRWLYGSVLALYGGKVGHAEEADYTHDVTWNRAHRRVAPRMVQEMLRLSNVALFLGGMALLMGLSWWLTRSLALALATVVPLALSPTFACCISYRIGPDAVLFFAMCLALVFWMAFDLKGTATTRKAVVVIGILAGVATGCKVNGALVLLAYCGYLVARSRGLDRLANPVVSCVVASMVFSIMNVTVFAGTPLVFVAEVVRRRLAVIAHMNGRLGPMTFTDLFWSSLPLWPVLPALVPVLWRWIPSPIRWCGTFLVVGSLLTIERSAPQYLGPIELGAYYAVAIGGVRAYQAAKRLQPVAQ